MNSLNRYPYFCEFEDALMTFDWIKLEEKSQTERMNTSGRIEEIRKLEDPNRLEIVELVFMIDRVDSSILFTTFTMDYLVLFSIDVETGRREEEK